MADTTATQPLQNARIAKFFQEHGKSGQITKGELLNLLKDLAKGTISDQSLERMVEAATSGRDTVEVEQFISWLYQAGAGAAGAQIQVSPDTTNRGPQLGTPGLGSGMVYMAGLKNKVPQPPWPCEKSSAVHENFDKFMETIKGNTTLEARMKNKVKKCGNCGKPNAYTLKNCNSCGASLQQIEISFTHNIFMSFVHGIGKGAFPYTISLRKQTEEFMCFDDLLAVSMLHLNAIPTNVYIPDLRFLFRDPPRGLEIVNKLFDFAASVAIEQFWGNEEFRKKFLQDQQTPDTKTIEQFVNAGMNFPPSQFQLHLQFIHAPLLPFHHVMAKEGNHFTFNRFFPITWLRQALSLGDKVKMQVDEDTDIFKIVQVAAENGVNYEALHYEMMQNCFEGQKKCASWREEDFKYAVINGKVLDANLGKVDKDADAVQKQDKEDLQTYGRPYTAEGKPTGTYYKFAKKAEDVQDFGSTQY